MGLFGGIEAGGTKFVCMVARDPEHVLAEVRFPTTTPEETIRNSLDFFAPYARNGGLAAVGIASFGPLDLDPASSTFGYITTTPKPGWEHVDLCGEIRSGLDLPVAFDTDVNAAAFGEQTWVAENRSLDPFVYVTVGTGIGVGVIINGAPLHGLIHAEAGHFSIPHNLVKDPFPGVCRYHGDCLEGLASGPSMQARWGQSPETLPDAHPAWNLEVEYIALALLNLIYVYSPRRIVLGGGVSQHPGFHQAVRRKVQEFNQGYVRSPMLLEGVQAYIRPPALGNSSGALGAIAMAIELMGEKDKLSVVNSPI